MIINNNYNELQVGETTRLYLQLSDLKDSSGGKIHLEEIRKVVIEKLDNNHLSPSQDNQVVKAFYGYRQPRLKLSSSDTTTNFLSYLDTTGKAINLIGYYVQVVLPGALKGYYEIIDTPVDFLDANGNRVSQTLVISGIFSEISEDVLSFNIVDSAYVLTSPGAYSGCILDFNENFDYYEPLWQKKLFFFKDLSGYDFSTVGYNSGTSKYDFHIDDCTVQISTDNVSFTSYLCGNLFTQDMVSPAFFIQAFDNTSYDSNQIYYWKLFNPVGTEIVLTGSPAQNNAVVQVFYDSFVKFEAYTSADNSVLYRYYIDWTIQDAAKGGAGSYVIYWHYRRSTNSLEETSQDTCLIHDDFVLPTVDSKKKFDRENYYKLLQKYMPFFYFDYQVDDVLTQTLQAFGESIYDVQAKADQFLDILDPERAPTQCLPYLANLFHYNLQGSDVINWRQQIMNLPKILKKKGTLQGLVDVLALANVDVKSLVFYWQVTSPYVWTDYFSIENGTDVEYLDLSRNPYVQSTQDYYELYQSEGVLGGFGPNYSRYKVEYFSQDLNAWIQLFPIYQSEVLVYNLEDILGLSLTQDSPRTKQYSSKISWNFDSTGSAHPLRDDNGKISGLLDGTLTAFTPKPNDFLKVTYQYQEYPYEINSSSSSYQVNFDRSELCKDDYILSLDTADSRESFDSTFPQNKLIPLVNYNVRLLPDSSCYVKKDLGDTFVCLDDYDVCDICSKRNSLSKPLIYGYVRTKFPWSENVYNMDEYDGSTRPSYEPCDIDESFLDNCGCCWSSYFSISVEVLNLSNKMLQSVTDTINEFKPFHSMLRNLSFIGKIEDNVRVDDDQMNLEIRQRYDDYVELGYYPNQARKKRSESYYFAAGSFITKESDLQGNVYLSDKLVDFQNYPIGLKVDETDFLPTLNINSSRLVIEGPVGQAPHYGNSYSISSKDSGHLYLTSGTTDDEDDIPTYGSWAYNGPWQYSVYMRKFPLDIVQGRPVVGNNTPVTITKTGLFSVSTSVDLLSSGLQVNSEILGPVHTYQLHVESGATAGYYGISEVRDGKIFTLDYHYGGSYGSTVSFTIYQDGVPMDGFTSISGTLNLEEVYGEFDIGSSTFASDWDIKVPGSYVFSLIDNAYYQVENIVGNHVKCSGFANGAAGTGIEVAIFEKVLSSSSAYIYANTDTVYSQNDSAQTTLDFYNLVNNAGIEQLSDFLVGLTLNGRTSYYPIAEVFQDDTSKVRLDGFSTDEVISVAQPMLVRVFNLTNYKTGTDFIYPNSPTFSQVLEGTATGGSASSLVDSSTDFGALHVEQGDLVILRKSDDTFGSVALTGNTSGSVFTSLASTWIVNEHIGKNLFVNIEIYTVVSNTTNALTLDRVLATHTGIEAVLNTPLGWNTSAVPSAYSWAIVNTVSGNTLTFKAISTVTGSSSSLQQNGALTGSFGNGTLYRVIRRRIYDSGMDLPKTDAIQARIDPNTNGAYVPLENMASVSSWALDSDDQRNSLQIPKGRNVATSNILVGSTETVIPGARIVEKVLGQAQLDFSVYDPLQIDPESISVEVNGAPWEKVENWTNPEAAPGGYALRQFITEVLSKNEVKFWFGDGYTGKEVVPGDLVTVSYIRSGYLPGPKTTDTVFENESIVFEILNVNTGETTTVQAQ